MTLLIAVDPATCSIPISVRDEEDIQDIIEFIISVGSAHRNQSGCRTAILSDAAGLLAETDLYPIPNVIRKMFEDEGLSSIYAVEDLRIAINGILERSIPLEEISGINFMIPVDVKCEPDLFAPYTPKGLQEAFALTLSHVGAIQGNPHFDDAIVVASPAVCTEPLRMSFGIEVSDVDPEDALHFLGDSRRIVGNILFISTPGDFLNELSDEALWRSDDQRMLQLAIKRMAEKISQGAGTPNSKFHFGTEFHTSLQSWGGCGDGRHAKTTLETCARVIAGVPKEVVNPIKKRMGSKGQGLVDAIRADGARGLRTHIGKSHEGLRLMYWQRLDGTIEFANVGPKKQLQIFEGEEIEDDDE